MRTHWVDDTQIKLILAAMMPANRLAIEVSEATGLRIDDVLSLKTELVQQTNRPTVVDSKTGKKHRIYLKNELRERMLKQAGKVWIFPGRIKPMERHRTRQAVWKDMTQAAAIFKRNGTIESNIGTVSPHTARKRAAVSAFRLGGLDKAREILVHSDSDAAVTLLYALSDQAPKTKRKKASRKKKKPF